MKISCTKENLLRGLTLVSHVASKNITLPILNNVLLKARDGVLEISATNLEIGMNSRVRGKVEIEGSFTVNAKLLTDYVNLLANDRVDMEVKDQSLYISCANSSTIMRGLDAAEFPVIPTVEKKYTHVCRAQDLRAALSQVVFAVSNDESRPEISGIFFRVANNTLTLAATDSYRLAERVLSLESSTSEAMMIIPAKTTYELLRIMGDEEGSMTIVQSDTQALFSIGTAELVSRTIEGRYPDYTQIIPKTHTTLAEVSVDELTKAIRTASLFCKPGVNDVTLQFIPDSKLVTVSALNSQIGENTTTLAAKITGPNNDAVFNYRYLLDGLGNLGGEEAELSLENNTTPGVLRPKGGKEYLYIIMPIKQ